MAITLAFGSIPKSGGTFTFYRNLRPALMEYGIDVRCVSVGKAQARLWIDDYADEGCVLLAPRAWSIRRQAKAFVNWCEEEEVDIVMGVNSSAILSALPHLPERVRVLSRCANGFDHGYRITMSGRERLTRIVALTPRLAQDLVNHYSADPCIIELIPNGIDPEPFHGAASTLRGENDELSLGFLGRLEHNQKGVLHLPKITQELNARNVSFKLRIAGTGKHRKVLERLLSQEVRAGQVEFLGAISPKEVPQFLAETDIFVFTSHFEGCPNALLEAMMAGCVPVAWLIDGITDFILDENLSRLLCPTGDYSCFADHVENFAFDRKQLQTMSTTVSSVAQERFTNQKTAAAYANLIERVMEEDPPPWPPRPWREFSGDPNFEYGWRLWLRNTALTRWVKAIYSDLRDFMIVCRVFE